MPRAVDLLFGKIVIKNQLAPEAAVRECLRALEGGPRDGDGPTLADVMVSRGVLTPQAAEKARRAVALAQFVKTELAYARLAVHCGYVLPEVIDAALGEQKAREYRVRVGDLLVQRGALTLEQHQWITAELEARMRAEAEGSGDVTHGEGGGLARGQAAPPPPGAGSLSASGAGSIAGLSSARASLAAFPPPVAVAPPPSPAFAPAPPPPSPGAPITDFQATLPRPTAVPASLLAKSQPPPVPPDARATAARQAAPHAPAAPPPPVPPDARATAARQAAPYAPPGSAAPAPAPPPTSFDPGAPLVPTDFQATLPRPVPVPASLLPPPPGGGRPAGARPGAPPPLPIGAKDTAPRPAAPPPPVSPETPPPPPRAPTPSGMRSSLLGTLGLRGAAREFAASALRDEILSADDLQAALAGAPPQAREDAWALGSALLGLGMLAAPQFAQIDAALKIEAEGAEFNLEGYYLVAPLGFSPDGPVVLGRRQRDGRAVALHLLPPPLSRDPRRVDAFRRRAGAFTVADHPNLAKAIDSGISGETLYFALDLPDAKSLVARIGAGERLAPAEAVAVGLDLAGALAELARAGVLHGAVRPESIFFSPEGTRLGDVGLAPVPEALSPEEPPPSTDLPRYLAPEAIRGEALGPSSDMYSLAVSLYHGLTGRAPFDGPTTVEVSRAHHEADLPDPASFGVALPPRLLGLLRAATAKQPEARYTDYEMLIADLNGLAAEVGLIEGEPHSDKTVLAPDSALDVDLKEMRQAVARRRATQIEVSKKLDASDIVPPGLPKDLLDEPHTRPELESPVLMAGEQAVVDYNIGRVLSGRYRLMKRLGAGGMGAVYKAEHLLMHKVVAVKILHPDIVENPDTVQRFQREVRAASRFSHPNVVQIYDAGEDAGPTHYMVMEYVEGETLKQIIEREGALGLPRALAIMRQSLGAVDDAHRKGIVHRDMKSDNIMIAKGPGGAEVAKIMDFGIAKFFEGAVEQSKTVMGLSNQQSFKTKKGVVTGTPQYMSPEQASGDPNIDHRTDLYSIGVIFYEMVLGELPFKSNTAMGYLGKHIVEPPIPPREARPDIDLPKDLERILLKSLEKSRDLRYQTAGEMLDDLERTVAPAIEAGGGKKGGRRLVKLVLVVLVLGALGAGGWYGLGWWRAGPGKRTDGGSGSSGGGAPSSPTPVPVDPEVQRKAEFDRLVSDAARAEAEGSRDMAIDLYERALKVRDEEAIRKRVDRLRWRKRVDAAREHTERAKQELAKDEPDTALAQLEQARKHLPESQFEDLLARAQHARFLKQARYFAGQGQDKEAAARYRQALRLVDALEAQRGLDTLVAEMKRTLAPDARKAYLAELLAELETCRGAKDFRGALRLARDAQVLDDDFAAAAKRVNDLEPLAREEGYFREAERAERRVKDDLEATETDRREVASRYKAYLDHLAAFDSRASGIFKTEAQAAYDRWSAPAPGN